MSRHAMSIAAAGAGLETAVGTRVVCALVLASWVSSGLAQSVSERAADDASAVTEAFQTPPEPPARPQVPFASDIPEVTVYGQQQQFGLPDSVRQDIWDSERRQMEALMLERERMSNELARDGFEAILGDRVSLLPAYNPARERQIDYGVNDSAPAGVINLFGVGVGKKKR